MLAASQASVPRPTGRPRTITIVPTVVGKRIKKIMASQVRYDMSAELQMLQCREGPTGRWPAYVSLHREQGLLLRNYPRNSKYDGTNRTRRLTA